MRFCMLTTFYPPFHFGGDAIFVRALSRALVADGHHVEVVHCEDAYRLRAVGPPAPEASDDGVLVHRLRSPFGVLSPLVTHQIGRPGLKASPLGAILGRGFDVVNLHNISLIGGPGLVAMSRAPVTLYTIHEHWLLCPTHIFWKNREKACDGPQCVRCCLRSGIPPQLWRYTSLIDRSLRAADALLCPSQFTADRHRELAPHAPIHVMPTFSDLDPGPPPDRPRAGVRPRFLFVGRVTASKGIAELVEAFSAWKEFDLDVVGDGDLLAGLQARHAAAGNIRFFGYRRPADLVEHYRDATAFILPSLAPEVFPLTVLEAMACGTPAVVRDAGGSREAIDRTGGGAAYRTLDELKAILVRLTTDDWWTRRLARRARTGFEQFYTRRRYLDRYLGLVDALRGRQALPVPQEEMV